jgi:NAD(P)H-hydrate epimerase
MPLPVISVSQMRSWEERTWDHGTEPAAVMRKAGHRLAQEILSVTAAGDFILLLAGKGNNGGDTLIASELLPGRDTLPITVKDPCEAIKDVQHALLRRPAYIIDGLFGIGLNRDVDSSWVRVIEMVNQSGRPILSVDCPSGLDADAGLVRGESIRAQATITFGAPKRGLVLNKASKYVGRLIVAGNIGLVEPPPESDEYWLTESDMYSMLPKRAPESHKGNHGHLAIIAGSTGYHGAAVISARAALRARPGLVSVFTPSYQAVAAHLQSVMVHPWGPDCVDALNRSSAILIGPGLAGPKADDSLKIQTLNLWNESTKPIIVDASALDWLPQNIAPSNSPRIITPHPGEAARLLGLSVAQVQEERVKSARELADLYKATVMLKGRHTVIAQYEGPALINSTGNPGLAQGGSGDALAGLLSAFMAQPSFHKRAIQACAYSAWWHGCCADSLDKSNSYWGMDDLIHELGQNEFH